LRSGGKKEKPLGGKSEKRTAANQKEAGGFSKVVGLYNQRKGRPGLGRPKHMKKNTEKQKKT